MTSNTVSAAPNGELTTAAAGRSSRCLPNDDVGFSSMFSRKASTSFTASPPYSDFFEFEYSPFVMQHQDLINRHALCLTRLREKARELESLLRENAALRSFNSELNGHLRFLAQASLHKRNCLASSSSSSSSDYNMPFGLSNDFRNFANGIRGGGGGGDELCEDESPTSVMEVQSVDTGRVSLPKSISVRSNGYLRMSQQPAATAVKTQGRTRPRAPSSLNGGHKVYVRGGKKEEEPLELEVYHQGMFKTELCNKWQETGACPYGDHCQFAHGIEELRPVIRHPRYKTEVCRMVLAGDICPYGHRCHFRHALTEQERYVGHLKLQALKLDR